MSTYKCAICGGVFEATWSEEEVKAEFEENFPGEDFNDAVLICDDCYNMMRRGNNFIH